MDEKLFIGRRTEMQQMESILQPQSENRGASRKVLVLGGMGGIGKTQLAISYAKQHHTSYTSVFWLDATSELSLKTSLRKVAHRVLPPKTVSELGDEQIPIHVSNWLSECDNTGWLLMFDNYDDPDHYSVRKYFPSVAHGSIIITTRQPDRVTGDKVRMRSMSKEDDSLRVLATRSGRANVESGKECLFKAGSPCLTTGRSGCSTSCSEAGWTPPCAGHCWSLSESVIGQLWRVFPRI
jgi:hypothetical protein